MTEIHEMTLQYHEAGHAVAQVIACAAVRRPTPPLPRIHLPVHHIQLNGNNFNGHCMLPSIYSPQWPTWRLTESLCDAMQWEIIVLLAGAAAVAYAYFGNDPETIRLDITESEEHGDASDYTTDLAKAIEVCVDFERVTGTPLQPLALLGRTVDLLSKNWASVDALAAALTKSNYIDGFEVMRIINGARTLGVIG